MTSIRRIKCCDDDDESLVNGQISNNDIAMAKTVSHVWDQNSSSSGRNRNNNTTRRCIFLNTMLFLFIVATFSNGNSIIRREGERIKNGVSLANKNPKGSSQDDNDNTIDTGKSNMTERGNNDDNQITMEISAKSIANEDKGIKSAVLLDHNSQWKLSIRNSSSSIKSTKNSTERKGMNMLLLGNNRSTNENNERPGIPDNNKNNTIARLPSNITRDDKKKALEEEEEKVLVLHMGKAGGGTTKLRLTQNHVPFKECHPEPCPQKLLLWNNNNSSRTSPPRHQHKNHVLITIRDPIDRFISAFYWRSLLVCRPYNETRIADYIKFKKRPDKFCKTEKKSKKEVTMLQATYQHNATLLAEALCSSQGRPYAAKIAKNHIGMIRHAKSSIGDWLGNNNWRNKTNITAIVLEPGFDLEDQIRGFIQLVKTTATKKQTIVTAKINNSNQIANVSRRRQRRGSKRKKKRHSSLELNNYTEPSVSELGKCCIARHYQKDYQLMKELAMYACHGEYANACREALESIVSRRAHFLDKRVSCQHIVTTTTKTPRT